MKTQAGSLVDDSKIEKACPMVFKNLKSRQQSRGEGSSIVVIEAFWEASRNCCKDQH